jgi:hypothetical protein
MLKTVASIALILILALGGGTASAWYMIDRSFGIDAIAVGPWTAHPDRGTPQADPYSLAHFAREGKLVLGQAEGVTFTATRDSLGRPLSALCRYNVEGGLPAARFWTIHVAGVPGVDPTRASGDTPALHSLALLRAEDNSFDITVSRHPAPGNWLRVETEGEMALVLTLYDTPIAASARVADVELPRILELGCDA